LNCKRLVAVEQDLLVMVAMADMHILILMLVVLLTQSTHMAVKVVLLVDLVVEAEVAAPS
jgi:hypothetical protein